MSEQEYWSLEQFQEHYRLNQSSAPLRKEVKSEKRGRVVVPGKSFPAAIIDHEPGTSLTLRLPVPPSANRYWRHGQDRRGRTMVYRSQEATLYINGLRDFAQRNSITPFTGEVVYIAEYYIRKSRDVGNNGKVLQDALQSIAYHNDGQINEIHEYRKPFEEGGYVIVTVAAANQAS